jgi:hypothetical protein
MAHSQQQLAHLAPAAAPDATSASAGLHQPTSPGSHSVPSSSISDTPLSRSASSALFVRADLATAKSSAAKALSRNPNDLEAQLVSMETAVLQTEEASALEHALSLCEYGGPQSNDARVQLAEARVQAAADNPAVFHVFVPRIQDLLANSRQPWGGLSEALLNASMNGVAGLEPYSLARSAGILTNWRIVGPLTRRALAGADPDTLSRNDSLSQPTVQGRMVENFQFPDGTVVLPDYLARPGTFFAAAQFAILEPGPRSLRVKSRAALEIYVDGTLALHVLGERSAASQATTLDLAPGPHRVLVRFDSARTSFRVQVVPARPELPAQPGLPEKELAYLRNQRESLENRLAAVQPASSCALLNENRNLDPPARRFNPAAQTGPRLEGCGPESLAFAEALSLDGKHLEAALAIRKLISAAPLNRGARLMLIRELQLAGDDSGAQVAAAEWIRIAPNATSYRRMAASAQDESMAGDPQIPFYMPFRRKLPDWSRQDAERDTSILIHDSVAIARRDGADSLYVHRAVRANSFEGAEHLEAEKLPKDAQPLTLRIVAADGSESAWLPGARLRAGDTLDLEYLVNFPGDGGISQHPELFQHVFDSSSESAARERFVVLSPAAESDRGVVIITGQAPAITTQWIGSMLARVWDVEKSNPQAAAEPFSVVRVVEQDNGWTTPRSAERRRKIETAHPGPRQLDATLLPVDELPDSFGAR